jgi:hypothetical protein
MLAKNLKGWDKFSTLFVRMLLDGVAAAQALTQGKWQVPFTVLKAHADFYRLSFTSKKDRYAHKITPSPLSIVWAYFVAKKKKYSDLGL